jgi:hypothetical protein
MTQHTESKKSLHSDERRVITWWPWPSGRPQHAPCSFCSFTVNFLRNVAEWPSIHSHLRYEKVAYYTTIYDQAHRTEWIQIQVREKVWELSFTRQVFGDSLHFRCNLFLQYVLPITIAIVTCWRAVNIWLNDRYNKQVLVGVHLLSREFEPYGIMFMAMCV